MTIPAPMELQIGMNARRTESFHTRLVRGVIDLIMSHPIVVLDSVRRDLGSGSLLCCCRLDSRRWLLIITSVGVDWQEGEFFLFVAGNTH